MFEGDGGARLAGSRHLDCGQLDIEDLRQRLGGEQVGLVAPLQVGHQIGLGGRLAQGGPERQLVGQRESEMMALDGVKINGLPGDLAVAVVQLSGNCRSR